MDTSLHSLHLAKKLADRGFSVRVCSTTINPETINKQIPEKYSASIKMVELCLPKLPKLTTNEIPVDMDHIVLKTLKLSKSNFAKILKNLKPDLVIYDLLLQWAEGVANEQGIPAMKFVVMGAAVFSYFYNSIRKPEVEWEGLELSNVNFIWVVRFPEREGRNLEDVLPKGFLERIGERGRVLDKCTSQSRILNHSSIGGFVSPCGWHNVIECLDLGVPIIAMPIHLDQPMNAKLMVGLGVAVEIIRDDDRKIHREEIVETLKGVVTRGSLRAKVRDVSKNLKSIGNEEMDTAAKELIQLCKK